MYIQRMKACGCVKSATRPRWYSSCSTVPSRRSDALNDADAYAADEEEGAAETEADAEAGEEEDEEAEELEME